MVLTQQHLGVVGPAVATLIVSGFRVTEYGTRGRISARRITDRGHEVVVETVDCWDDAEHVVPNVEIYAAGSVGAESYRAEIAAGR